MELTIIIVNYNCRQHTLQCLLSINQNTQKLDYEIIVIDNGSQDKSVDFIKRRLDTSFLSSCRFIENKLNLGFAKAINQGIHLACGRYLLLLNNDTLVLPGSLSELVGFMSGHPEAIAAGGKVLNPDGTLQFSCRRFPGYLTALFNRKSIFTRLFKNNRISKKYLMADWPHNEARPVDWASACYLIMRREAIEKVGLLDEEFFMYCEDVDWCWRAREKGLRVFYFPGAAIIHISKDYAGDFIRKIISHHQSMFRYYKKHLSKNLLLDGIVLTAVSLRAGFILLLEFLNRTLPGIEKRGEDVPQTERIS
jgi:GT2 family glycosyltransferase